LINTCTGRNRIRGWGKPRDRSQLKDVEGEGGGKIHVSDELKKSGKEKKGADYSRRKKKGKKHHGLSVTGG